MTYRAQNQNEKSLGVPQGTMVVLTGVTIWTAPKTGTPFELAEADFSASADGDLYIRLSKILTNAHKLMTVINTLPTSSVLGDTRAYLYIVPFWGSYSEPNGSSS